MCYFVEGYVCLWACNAMGVRNTTTRPQAYTGRRARHFLHGIATELVASIWMPVENNDEVVDAFWEEEPFDYCTCKEGKSLMNFINILFMQGIYRYIYDWSGKLQLTNYDFLLQTSEGKWWSVRTPNVSMESGSTSHVWASPKFQMAIGGAERIAGALLRFVSASKTLEPLLLSASQKHAALGHTTLSAWVFLCNVSY